MKRIAVWSVLAVFVIALPFAFAQQSNVSANAGAVPRLIRFSGVVKDSKGQPLTGVTGVTFTLYKQQEGGAALWIETQNVQADVGGHYTALLGATKAEGLPVELFTSAEARWLGVQAAGQPEQPRVLLLSVPYALKAADAETVGGLPPSAFVLVAPTSPNLTGAANGSAANSAASASPAATSNVTTTGGTVNAVPLWTTATNIQTSAISQTGSGTTAAIGINTTTPATTLDVGGAATIRGLLNLPATGTATATAGKNSQALNLAASAFKSGTGGGAVPQTFRWQAEPANNNTGSPSGTLNLLFGAGTSAPAETGLNIGSNGQIHFAVGQTFPGTGTITGVTAGTGLTGGGSNGNVALKLNTATTDARYAQLAAANTFTADQTVTGNLAVSGTFRAGSEVIGASITGFTGVSAGSGFYLGGNLFGFGSFAGQSAFLGFAGNTSSTGVDNTGIGWGALSHDTNGGANTAVGNQALISNTTGGGNVAVGFLTLESNRTGAQNTAVGGNALFDNNNGSYNTAIGFQALVSNTGGTSPAGSFNTALGYNSLFRNSTGLNNTGVGAGAGNTQNNVDTTGSNNTFLGANSGPGTQTGLSNATAVGANAEVTASNSLVLGSINGVNGATANTNVGIGTTTPAARLDVHGTGNFTGLVSFASGQTFPGAGTVTSIGSGAGLAGGPITGSGTLSIATGGITNAMLAPNAVTNANIADGSVSAAKIAGTAATLGTNAFAGNQTVTGNVTATGTVLTNFVNASVFYLVGNAFGFGNFAKQNVFLGFSGNVTNAAGMNNTAVGGGALPSNLGNANTAVGHAALANTVSGNDNTAVGDNALVNGNASFNTALGSSALLNTSTGGSNTAMGYHALQNNNTGGNNTAIGVNALNDNTGGTSPAGSYNTAIGLNALYRNSTGFNNTGVGAGAGNTQNSQDTTGSNNTFLGANSGPGTVTTLDNATAIGANATVTAPNSMVLGSINGINGASKTVSVGIGTTAPTQIFTIGQNAGHAIADSWDTYSSRRWKTNIHTLQGALDKVEQLRGVSYDLQANGKHELGVIAEEVGEVVPEVVSYEDNGKDARGVDYSRLTALLIEATKEQQRLIRKQQNEIRDQQAQIRAQQGQIARLAAQVKTIETAVQTARRTGSQVRRTKAQVSGRP